MAATIYYDNDADLSALNGKTIAILGYGSQGHAHAQNLRDSGCNVVVAELPNTANFDAAVKAGFTPVSIPEAVKQADLVVITLPDELQGGIFKNQIRENLKKGAILVATHGFNVHYGQFDIPEGCCAIMIAPKGPGHLVRSEFVKGGGVPCLIALAHGAADAEKKIGLA
ncbi:MAG: NAD(P)-dependent oxidoreductase, partial [Planctomycetia bacterium]|nr:NAD(P)-dependent oxidoreductase [Planctomycetia bacterium]